MNLEEVLEKHKLWLENKPGGERADLRWADLRWADLQGANLRWADLQGAYLQQTCVLTFQYQKDLAICTGERLTIGCEDRCLSEWADVYEEIGKKHDYTEEQIEAYGQFILICIEAASK